MLVQYLQQKILFSPRDKVAILLYGEEGQSTPRVSVNLEPVQPSTVISVGEKLRDLTSGASEEDPFDGLIAGLDYMKEHSYETKGAKSVSTRPLDLKC